MSHGIEELGIFLHLSQAYQRRQQPLVRARMLVLAGAIASELQLETIAEYCRSEILSLNPNHMVRRWSSIALALRDDEFQAFLKQMRRRFPSEKAERILVSFGLQLANERDTYYSDEEYAASILATTPSELASEYGQSGDES